MKSHEEIKKGLECCYGMVCGTIKVDCPYEGMRGCHDIVLRDAIAYIKQLEAKVPRWIPVEERLPEDDENVLIFVRTMPGWCHIEVDWRDGNSWYNNAETDWNKITHWMPLPDPPEVTKP